MRRFLSSLPLRACIRVGVLTSVALLPAALTQAQPDISPVEAFVTGLDALAWGPPGGGNGFPEGVQTVRVGVDAVTGGITYYARFPAGSHFDLHWHTHHEYVAVLQGNVVIELGTETHRLSPGSYVVIPGTMNHSWDVPPEADVIILVRRAGPADFNFVKESLNN